MPDILNRLQGARSTLGMKTPCHVATTANITLSGLQTVDGVALAEGDRVLVKNQTDATLNGIRIAATSAWARAKDWDGNTDIVQGTAVYVANGTAASGFWVLTTSDPIEIGTDSLIFALLANAVATTDNAIARFNGASGALQNSGVTIDDADIMAGAKVLASNGTTADTLENYLSREHWVEDFGALGDGTTNDTAAIQAAIDRCELVGGGIVRFKAKTYSVTDLTIDSTGVVLRGIAGGDLFNAATVGTILKARSSTTNVLTVGAGSTASSAIRSVTVEDMTIDGNSIASRSLYIRPITNSVFRNLVLKGSSTSQMEHANYVTGAGYTGLNFMYQVHFESIFVNSGSTSAKGIVLSAIDSVSGVNGIAFCQFSQIHITHKDGTAFEINDADDNQFLNVAVSRITAGTGIGIDIVGNVRPDLLQANMFYFCHAGPGGWRTQGSAAYDNVVFGLGQVDGSPVTITSPSWLSYIMDTGEFLFPSFSADGGAGNTIVNRLKLSGSITGSGVTLASDGADTNIDLKISPKGTGNAIIPSAQTVIGHTGTIVGGVSGGTARVGVHGISGQTQGYSGTRWTADASGVPLTLTKSRGAAVGTHTVVQSGDTIGRHIFGGSDGTQFIPAGEIRCEIDGTPGTNDMPGALILATTADGAAAVTDRIRVGQNGLVSTTANASVGRGAPVTKTADFTVAAGENWLICNKASSTTVTLPVAASFPGREIMIKTIQAQTVVSNASNVAPRTDSAAGTAILPATDGAWATLVSDGTNWIIMAGS